MAWSIARDYAAFNAGAEQLVRRAGWPYVLLRPPAVTRPLLVLADLTRAPALNAEFRRWCATPEATVVDAEALRGAVPHELGEYYGLPGREDLLRCKWFAAAAQTPVAMYAAETFGGVPEYEWCWLLAPGVERFLVLVRRHREVRIVRRRWLFLRRTIVRQVLELVTVEMTPGGGTVERPYSHSLALVDQMCRHLGVEAPGGFFRPHTRGFDSGPYQVLPPRKRRA